MFVPSILADMSLADHHEVTVRGPADLRILRPF